MSALFTTCEVCGKRVFLTWFPIFGADRRLKCGQCAAPPRAELQRVFADHDASDEDRTHHHNAPQTAAEGA